jgi:hypothetical protein
MRRDPVRQKARADKLQLGWERSTSINPTADAAALLSRHLAGIEARMNARERASLLGMSRPDEELSRLEAELARAVQRSIRLAERGDFRCYEHAAGLCGRFYRLGAAA